MSRINDLLEIERPREKAERFGIESLKDEELLALIIGSGTVGHSSLDISREIIKDCIYMSNLLNKPEQYFYSFKGLKKGNTFKLLATFEIAKRINEKQLFVNEENRPITSDMLYRRYRLKMSALEQEQLIIVILNKNKQIINEKVLFVGNENCVGVNYRDILRLLMIHNGYYFYLIHNHPNNSFSPSNADIQFTEKIEGKARHINVKLLDHIIISRDGYYSFLQEKLIGLEEKRKIS